MAQVHEVVSEYRKGQRFSLREFADAINEKLINTNVSHATVHRWEDVAHPNEPDMQLLFECLATYRDWRRQWATDCMKAMWPDLFEGGVIRIELPTPE